MDDDDPQDDDAIVAEVLAGRPERFAVLIRRHHARLAAALACYCRSRDEIEEYAQEGFVRAFGALDGFDRAQPFFPWLRAIALNAFRMDLRRRRRATERLEAYAHHRRMEIADAGLAEDSEARVVALRACLDELPARQRDLLHARYHDGRAIGDLARERGSSESAMKVALLRLRRVVAACIEARLGTRT